MRIAVLSDTRLPTSAAYPGHGLGKSALAIAEGLAQRGHQVTLFAGPGSESAVVPVTTGGQEVELARAAFLWAPDVAIDCGHEHCYQRLNPGYPVLNRSADREGKPGRNAIYASRAHALVMGDPDGQVIYTGVDVDEASATDQARDYLLWLGPVDIPHKGVHTAIQVARMAGMALIIAGTGTLRHEGFIGPLYGETKKRLMRGARAVLVTGEIEAGPRVAIEAAACGTPVVGLARGGTPEYIGQGESGYACTTVEAMVARLRDELPDAERCRGWVQENRSLAQMINGYEAAAKAAVASLASGQMQGVNGMTGAEWREKHRPAVQMSLDGQAKGSLG